MNEASFVEKREPDWKRLVELCDRADASPAFLQSHDFDEMVRVYRRVSGDLAIARAQSTNLPMVTFLNDIVGRAYGLLYRSPRKSLKRALVEALMLVAQTGRRRKWFIISPAIGLVVSALFAFFLIDALPMSKTVFIPEGSRGNVTAWVKGLPERSSSESMAALSMYASNNPLVAVESAGLSAASFGLGGAYIVYMNGTQMGALAHEMARAGKLHVLLIWLLPHGVTELSGLFVSAGAGFTLGAALINPGRRKRGQSLREAGKDAIVLLATSAVMMFMAAPIEGYFSFNPRVPLAVKLIVAILEAGAWAAFWIGFGRDVTPVSAEPVA